ncbi:MAG: hypothetical protein ACOYON_06965 [Fimbriimonas sp.]
MLALLALGLTNPLATTYTFELGATVGGEPYYSVADTTLDAELPDQVFGASPYLSGGPRKAILIRFSELRHALGANLRVTNAYLELTPTVKGTAPLTRADLVQAPWGEGPFASISSRLVPSAVPVVVNWASTWKQRRTGARSASWQQAGASGPQDAVAIAGASGAWGETFRVEGLGATVQAMVDRPWADEGIALRFGAEVEFYSSQYPTGHPRLVVTAEPAPARKGADLAVRSLRRNGDQWEAELINLGDRPISAYGVEWWIDEKKVAAVDSATPIGVGERRVVSRKASGPQSNPDPRTRPVEVRALPGVQDVDPSNNALTSYEGAKSLDVAVPTGAPAGFASAEVWAQNLVQRWNEVAAERSRFAADPEGALVRLQIASFDSTTPSLTLSPAVSEKENWRRLGDALGMAPLSALRLTSKAPAGYLPAFAGPSGIGDNRYDGTVPSQVALPTEPEINPVMELLPPTPYGPLASFEVAWLNASLLDPKLTLNGFLESKPKTALVSLRSMSGIVLADVVVRILQVGAAGDTEVSTQKTSPDGAIFIGSRDGKGPFGNLKPDLSNGLWLLEATRDGVTDRRWLPAWRLFDLTNRSKLPTALLDLRFDLPLGVVERATDLALNRFVTSSTDLAANILARLVDGTPDTAVTLGSKPGDWVELDLGRDRTIGEVVLVTDAATVPGRVDVRTYSTGEKPEEGGLWFSHPDLNFLRRSGVKSSGPTGIVLRGPGVQVRYVRIVNVKGGNLSLQSIRIHPMRP